MKVEYKRAAGPLVVGKGAAASGATGRTVSGWITTFGLPADHAGDVIDEKAVDRHLAEHGDLLPGLSGHDAMQMIGWHRLKKVPGEGVWSDFTFLEGIKQADEDLVRVKSGAMAFSIGFISTRDEFRQGKRWILDLDLLEASVVLIPMNPRATIEARSGDTKALIESIERFRRSIRTANTELRRSNDSPEAILKRMSDLARKLAA